MFTTFLVRLLADQIYILFSKLVLIGFLLTVASEVNAQNYTSVGDGSWTVAGNWNNTSGWGPTIPPVNGTHGIGTITMTNTISITGNYLVGTGCVLNIQAAGNLTVTGNMTLTGAPVVNVAGILTIHGNLILNAPLNILPGGSVNVIGSLTSNSNQHLKVGTNVNPPPFANLVVHQALNLLGGGSALIDRNGRVAVYGNVTDGGGGGTSLTVNNGGQMYVNGNIAFSGGGNTIVNNNSSTPFGLYVNGTTTNAGGAASTTTNLANIPTMQSTNLPFFNWAQAQLNSPLPITLVGFQILNVNKNSIDLRWTTASEINFDYFLLEKSTNGTDFANIANVKGQSINAGLFDYTFSDINPFVGLNYYRLKSVDLDGSIATFNTVLANFDVAKEISLFPNPITDGEVTIRMNFTLKTPARVIFLNLFGLIEASFTTIESECTHQLNLKPGIYQVIVNNERVLYSSKMIVK